MTNLIETFNDNISIPEDWLDNVKDYQFKILLLTSILADNSLSFRGTLKTMCDWLGIKSYTGNHRTIKKAIQNLSSKGYIFCKVQGRTYHVSISNKGLRSRRIYKVRKIWIEAFKKYNQLADNSITVDWIKILRVFIYLLYLKSGEIVTLQNIADMVDISKETARKALIAIMACNLEGLGVDKRIIKDKYLDNNGNTYWRTKGQEISIAIKFK